MKINKLQKILEKNDEEREKLLEEMNTVGEEKICRYRNCKKKFRTENVQVFYCCPEHYKLENRERTRDKNIEYKQMKQAALSLAISEQDSV